MAEDFYFPEKLEEAVRLDERKKTIARIERKFMNNGFDEIHIYMDEWNRFKEGYFKEFQYFKKISYNNYKCLKCNHKNTSFMGIMSHIKKHKNEETKLAEAKLRGEQLNLEVKNDN